MAEETRQRPVRRALVIALVAVAVATGLFVLANGQDNGSPQADSAANTAPPASPEPPAPAPSTPQPQPGAALPASPGKQLDDWAAQYSTWLEIPQRSMLAYAKATITMGQEQPGCHVSWVTLAGIGKNASDHGRVGGVIGEDGRPAQPIGTVELLDFNGTVVSERDANGPMQLTPAIWDKWARSASGAGAPDPQNLDDAALTAARALCGDGGRDLSDGPTWWNAVSSLQDAPLFLHRVLATANVYGTVAKTDSPPKASVLKAVYFAIEKIGLPYVWGGNGIEGGHEGFDCSGLTTAAYGNAGITLKRTAHWQYGSVPLVPVEEEPQLGDLVFFGNPSTKIHHVGIYVGNKQMVDAPTFGQAVQVHAYRRPGDDYAGAGRPAN
ncbi:C40 family peptidase [Amycolatopsis sp. YIM 10]|uniref:C40 family peptidase n=1 Tax=Amycolatopsis sp. YIM 10 TaxID=2653857 RepID=UPI00128FE210|nr:C40 family peptidase [Amycolatopsis sp. YIM 10]QFU87086.1 Murein DD-endopeptidase MepH precursor [Amycolatopsis sp. YIM 10]